MDNSFTKKGLITLNQNAECGSDFSDDSLNFNKLLKMTAADFDRDRYARHVIHEAEIKDYVRTITFQNSIEYCAEKYIKNKVVLVVRCGVGLLPLLCVRNGKAKKVIGLEQSACIEYARCVVKDNMYGDKITLIQSSVHELKKLPHGLDQVDVIVSDFMGECVLSQGDQMEQVIQARDRFLKPNGIMIPMTVTIYGRLTEQRQHYQNQRLYKKNPSRNKRNQSLIDGNDSDSSSDTTLCSWWSDVYGFDMRSKIQFLIEQCYNEKEEFYNEEKKWCIMPDPLIRFFDFRKVISDSCFIKEFDMYKCTMDETRHVKCKDLKLKCTTPYSSSNGGDFGHMLELFMVVDFPNGIELAEKNDAVEIGFSTSSCSPCTRYRQTGLLLRDQLIVEDGDEVIINEFHIWRGSQKNELNKLFDVACKSTYKGSQYEDNLKLRFRYSFVNKHIKAVDRCCVYILTKYLF